MIKLILKILGIFLLLLILAGGYYYFNQEKMIFAPIKLSPGHSFQFEHPFEEVFLLTPDNYKLNALHFKTDNPLGVVYYLHGKSGNLQSWGGVAKTYLESGYDVFLLDYRGFGKSEGKIESENQLYEDAQLGMNYLMQIFPENQITLIGFSLGSGIATDLARRNQPKELILLAPSFQIDEKFKKDKFYLPKFLCKYEFPIDEILPDVKVPIQIIYGDSDSIIDIERVRALKSKLKSVDKIIELKNQGHNQIENNPDYHLKWNKNHQ